MKKDKRMKYLSSVDDIDYAYGAGVDFVKLIENNVVGKENNAEFNNYDDDVVMMMYDSVVIQKIEG